MSCVHACKPSNHTSWRSPYSLVDGDLAVPPDQCACSCRDASQHPPTGLPPAVEDILSSTFIPPVDLLGLGQYGTRAQTVVLVMADGKVHFHERAW